MEDWRIFQNKSTLELIKLFQGEKQPEEVRDSAFFAIFHKFQEIMLYWK